MQDLKKFYQLYSQNIYRYLYSLTHDPHWSEDLLSETFLKLFEDSPHLKIVPTLKPGFL